MRQADRQTDRQGSHCRLLGWLQKSNCLIDVFFMVSGNGALGESRYYSPRSCCQKRTWWVKTVCHADEFDFYCFYTSAIV